MNQGTKQRIVGTVVLLALALIFLPIIFDGEGSYQAPLSSRIPEPPVITLLPETEPMRPVLAIADDAATVIADASPDLAPATTTTSATATTTEPGTTAAADIAPAASETVVPAENSIPAASEIAPGTAEQVADQVVEQVVAQQAVGNQIAGASVAVPEVTREIPTLDANGLPQGWSVRLGSFAEERNANNLLQRLQDAGYRAYTRQSASNGTRMTGVYVGPWLEQDAVRQYQRQLQEEFHLSGLVVRYEVEPIPE